MIALEAGQASGSASLPPYSATGIFANQGCRWKSRSRSRKLAWAEGTWGRGAPIPGLDKGVPAGTRVY